MWQGRELIERAVADGQLLESTGANIAALLEGATSEFYAQVLTELIEGGHWSELNDRFDQTLAFGTGG